MDDIKHKLLGFITKQGSSGKVPIIARSFDTGLHAEQEIKPNKKDCNVLKDEDKDLQSDREILESIKPEYFKENDFDPILHELEKLPTEVDGELLERDLSQLKKQQVVVSNKVLQLILEKQSSCQQEINRVIDVQRLLDETLTEIRRGRQDLHTARENITTASLGILANYRKRTILHDLLNSLNLIKTLLMTEGRMQELLSSGDFAGAISLLVECQSATAMYRHFTCVAALSGKLQDTLIMAEEQLDQALSQMCYKFDKSVYSELQAAYALLGKTQIAMDQLHMHFTSAVHNSAYQVVHSHTQHDPSKKQYAHICKNVPENEFIPCLVALCKAMWGIVLSYHQVVKWHRDNNSQQANKAEDNFESSLYEQYVHQKLESGLKRLWQDVQTRVSPLFMAADLTHFKFDEFLQLLAVMHRLEQIGEEFCGDESKELQNCVRAQSNNYFKRYHSARLDELRIFLENEVWTPCPVREDFSLLHLQEFRGLRYCLQQYAGNSPIKVTSRSSGSLDGSSVGGSFFTRFSSSGTPFDSYPDLDSLPQEENILDVTNDPSGYFSEESEDDTTENDTSNNRFKKSREVPCPLLTNTTLTVLRQCGKYLQMSKLLRSNATDVVMCLRQLFDYYLYAVYLFFASDLPASGPSGGPLSLKLQATLKRIKESLTMREGEICDYRVGEPNMSGVVELDSSETLHGLAERVVAVESLVFLADQFVFLKPYLESLEPQAVTIHILYNQSVSVAVEVRRPVYACVAWRAVDVRQTLTLMSRVNWELKDVMSQHSSYVDFILRDLQIFSMRLEEISKHVTVNQAVTNSLWANIAHQLADTFVEGFSSAKKCSNGGRGLMQLDWTQLVTQLEKMCSLRPIPHREFVEAYVKAYYLPETSLEAFVRDHSEYSSKQIIALISSACQTNKKMKQKLTAMIEDQEKAGIR